MNTVIAGKYMDKLIERNINYDGRNHKLCIRTNDSDGFPNQLVGFNQETIKDYQIITEDSRKSTSSSIVRGLIGGALLGPVGLIAGGVSGKNKKTYQIEITWIDDKKSIIEVDESLFRTFITVMNE